MLLDLDDLLPPGSPLSPLDPSGFKPLPENPHLLLDINSTTFPLAVSKYRSLLVDLATNTQKRKAFGNAAAIDASKRSWFEAMEMIVSGYRELAKPSKTPSLALSRTPTLEIDIISHTPNSEEEAQSSTTSPRIKRHRVDQVLRLVRRSGGRIRDSSISTATFWRNRAVIEMADGQLVEDKKLTGWSTGKLPFLLSIPSFTD